MQSSGSRVRVLDVEDSGASSRGLRGFWGFG